MKKKRLRYLELLLKEEIVEGRPETAFFSRRAKSAHLEILDLLERAACDGRVRALLLHIESLDAGWGRLHALRRALAAFRASGKPLYCFLESGGNAEYYLASSCQRIYMPPSAGLDLVGLSSEVFFLRDLLDKWGIEPQLHAEGAYKSAGEMFMCSAMSPPAREQLEALLDDIHGEFCAALAGRLGSGPSGAETIINGGPYSAREARELGLLDGLCYREDVVRILETDLGRPLAGLAAGKVLRYDGWLKRLATFRRPRIAIIDVLGGIVAGESRRDSAGRHVAGAATIGGFLEHARKSRRVGAVVVRVDSPGGSATAADSIWHAVSRLKEEKPVVFSFGDVAASGGYYIAAPGSRILAEPATITGSIGVLSGKFVARALMNRLQVHREALRRGNHAEFHSALSPFSPEENERLVRMAREFYREEFVKKVAAGRSMPEEAVDRAGQGRVWSGLRAREQGLVDDLGGLKEALEAARKLARIPEGKYRRVHYLPKRRLRDMLVPEFHPRLGLGIASSAIEGAEVLAELARCGILLWLPFRIRIR